LIFLVFSPPTEGSFVRLGLLEGVGRTRGEEVGLSTLKELPSVGYEDIIIYVQQVGAALF
jgi:hypothetical protein